MSTTDWQALDARIAPEIMGWMQWDELPSETQTAFLALSDACGATRFHHTTSLEMKPTTQWNEVRLDRLRRSWWSLKAEDPASDQSECPTMVMWIYDWQPHNDVAQALMAADKICDQGWDRELTRLGSAKKRYASFWKYRPIGDCYTLHGYADTNAKALCLAMEKWMDAQREKQDDPG